MLAFLKKHKKEVATAGIAAVALYFIFKKKTPEEKTQAQVEKEFQNMPGVLTYQLSNYGIWADALQAAMFDAGTDEDAIFAVFKKLKTPKDLLALIKAFGIRPYRTFGWKQGDYNLGQWFVEELSVSEKNEINKILKSNSINYQF